jgi:hypothetical protein
MGEQTRDVKYLRMEMLNGGFQNRIAGDALVGRMYLHGESGISMTQAGNCHPVNGRSDEASLISVPSMRKRVSA